MTDLFFSIRKAVPSDESAIRALFLEMLKSIGQTDAVDGYKAGYLDKYWRGGEDVVFVAETDQVIAYLSVEVCREPEKYLYLDDFSVASGQRNKGIGSALLQTAEAYGRECGIPAVLLHVEQINGSARRLYERLGYSVFRIDGNRLLMKKDLP